jgi:multicomponent K+:H+ antiporter subunit D
LPPLSGFLGKVLILHAALPAVAMPWIWAVLLGSGLLSIVALSRAGIILFWVVDPDDDMLAHTAWSARAVAPAAGLMVVVILISAFAGPLTAFTAAASEQLLAPDAYIRAVLDGGAR